MDMNKWDQSLLRAYKTSIPNITPVPKYCLIPCLSNSSGPKWNSDLNVQGGVAKHILATFKQPRSAERSITF